MPNQHARDDDPLKGKKSGGWSKYGGPKYGLVKEEITDMWNCQSCGKETPKELKPFLYEIYPGEYLRICGRCTSIANSLKEEPSYATYVKITRIIKRRIVY